MKKKMRVLSFLLALAMMLTLATACGEDTEHDATKKPTAAVNNGKGRAYGYLALSEEELLLWNQHVKCDAVIKHIGRP